MITRVPKLECCRRLKSHIKTKTEETYYMIRELQLAVTYDVRTRFWIKHKSKNRSD